MTILQCDPKAGYLAHKAEIDDAIAAALDSGWYILGQQVHDFEQEFAQLVGPNQHAVGVASGTDALVLALRACDIGVGDTVITVSHTAVATVAAIELTGATPLLVDINPHTFTLDLNQVADVLRAANPPINAIIPVHLYGQMADMAALCQLAADYGIPVIEDCSQAHGATWQGKSAGEWGTIAAFSLYPTKNLGALGDGGVITLPDVALAERIRRLRHYGWDAQRDSLEPGLNSRLDEMQAAILRVKLRYLEAENERRRTIAQMYSDGLANTDLILPVTVPEATHVYHQYVVRVAARDDFRAALRERDIGTAIHYPNPVHLQPAYRNRIPTAGLLAHTEQVVDEICSLPMFPQLSDEGVQCVVDAIRTVL